MTSAPGRAPYSETVTVERAPRPDRHGDPAGSPATVDVSGCVGWPTTSEEIVTGQDTVTSDWTLVVPAGTDVLPTDRITLRGRPYDIVGEPVPWRSPYTGADRGVQVRLRRTTG